MASISGEMQIGEASRYAGMVRQRLIGPPLQMAVLLVPTVAGAAVGVLAEFAILKSIAVTHPSVVVGAWFGAALGLIVGARLYRSWSLRRYRAALFARGFPKVWIPTISVEVDGLRWSDHWTDRRVGWGGVSELIRSSRYWIFVAGADGLYVPRRLFVDGTQERAFVAEALSHMGPEALARSTAAAKFVETV